MSHRKLTKGTVQASLNEIFLLDKETSKGRRPVFIADKDNLANPQIKAYSDESNFIYSNCWLWTGFRCVLISQFQ